MERRLTPGEIVIVAAGAVMFVFSFLAWFKFHSDSRNAWDSGLFPVATLAPVIGLVMALQVALTKLANVTMPERVGDFTWPQIHLVLAVFAVVLMVCYLILDKGPYSVGVGLIFDLLASIALVAGAVILRNERRGAVGLA